MPLSSSEHRRSAAHDPEVEDPFESGVPRRRLLKSSAAVGATTAELESPVPDRAVAPADGAGAGAPTVFVFNTGDGTVSVIDPEADEVVATPYAGLSSSFPSNQYTPRHLTEAQRGRDERPRLLWLNVEGGVVGLDPKTLEERARVDTGAEANWVNLGPDGERVVVSAREPAHRQLEIDADPASPTYGEVTGEIDRAGETGEGARGGPGPCDVTFDPSGHAYVPDLFGNTLTVIDDEAFEILAQVEVEPVLDGVENARPWMATAAWDDETLVVENNEGERGTESIWDVSDPSNPVECTRLTAEDGLGATPLTSEIGPDSEIAYVFTPGTEDVTAIDLTAHEVIDRIDVGGEAFVGTWGPEREKLYVPVQTADEVTVIDHASREVVATLPVGSKPYGATAGRVRPAPSTSRRLLAAFAAVGLRFDRREATHCLGNCHCGNHDH